MESDREEVKTKAVYSCQLILTIQYNSNEECVLLMLYLKLKTVIVFSCSDVVVQIVDARNPLLFRCPDLVSTLSRVVLVRKGWCVYLINRQK